MHSCKSDYAIFFPEGPLDMELIVRSLLYPYKYFQDTDIYSPFVHSLRRSRDG